MLYEERRIVLRRGSLAAFRAHVHGALWPALTEAGARPLCLLSGLIGLPAEELFLFTGFEDADAWQRAQPLLAGASPDDADAPPADEERSTWTVEQRARLLVDSGVRPKMEMPASDRRAVYGMRRFWIRPPDWPAFVRHSAEGIWPRIESQDARILGLFRDAAVTQPLECVLLTGYHGPAQWEETRGTSEAFARLPDNLRGTDATARTGRNAMTLRSYVCLMTAHWPG